MDWKNIFNNIPFLSSSKKESFEDSIEEYNDHILTALSPSHLKEGDDYVLVGSNFVRTLLVLDYEPVTHKAKIKSLTELADNVSFSYFFKQYSTAEVKKHYSQSIKENNIKADSRFSNGAMIAEAEAQIDSAKDILKALARQSDKMFMFHMLVHVVAPSLDELNRLTTTMKGRIGSIGTVDNPSIRAFDAFHSFLPLGKNHVEELTFRMMDSSAVASFFPFHENELFESSGIPKGRNTQTGNLVIVDDENLLNKHEFIIGISGSGKSTYLFQDMLKRWTFGKRIITIDPKGDFGKIYDDLGGSWVKFKLSGGNHINPFDLPKLTKTIDLDDIEELADGNAFLNRIEQLKTMFKLIHPDLSTLEENVLSICLRETYKKKGIDESTDPNSLQPKDSPLMQDLFDYIDAMRSSESEKEREHYEVLKRFHASLANFVEGGSFSDLFNAYTDVDTSTDLVCYDIFAFNNNEYIQRILFYNILSYITYDILNGEKHPTQVYIDEAHVLADPKVPLAMQYIFFMMKVLRSFNTGVTSATQSIKDFLSAINGNKNYGEQIISQSVQKLYLPMQESEVVFLEEGELRHNFSDEERSTLILKSGNKEEQQGKGIFFVGSKKIKLEVHLTELEKHLWFDRKPFKDFKAG